MSDLLNKTLKAAGLLAAQDNQSKVHHMNAKNASEFLFLALNTFDIADDEFARLQNMMRYYGDLRVKEAVL